MTEQGWQMVSDGELLELLGDDAAKWAAAFRQTAVKLGYSDMDEGWLIGWFANAIEGSHDKRTLAAAPPAPSPAPGAVEALKEACFAEIDSWKQVALRGAMKRKLGKIFDAALSTEAPLVELCACSLTGECSVIRNGKCCEICDSERVSFTPENVQKMFDGYAQRSTEAPMPVAFDFLAHLRRQREWSEKTFGPGTRTKGVIDHIRKELGEIEAEPSDIAEWIDVVILALDGAWRAGYEPEQIIEALAGKQAKNERRIWPDWRTMSPDQAIEHDRSAHDQRE